MKDFLHDLAERLLTMEDPLVEMLLLSVGGKIRTVRGAGIYRDRVNGYFMTFAKDELVSQAPATCFCSGISRRVASAAWQKSWFDNVNVLDDAYAAFTPLGSAMIATIRLNHAVKSRARQKDFLWRQLKTLQALLRHNSA